MRKTAQAAMATVICILLAALCGCTGGGSSFSPKQKEVIAAAEAWAAAIGKEDGDALWEMLSGSSHRFYEIELTGPAGIRAEVERGREALSEEALTPEDERRRIREWLSGMPEKPDEMEPKDYYLWRLQPQLTAGAKENTARLFAASNVADVTFSEDSATLILKHGDRLRYQWIKEGGKWRFDVPPSALRTLEDIKRGAIVAPGG